ncbi:S-adenosyl-L-methionine-dependent methyltransferase [Hypoxylon sp. FL0543]|nr:S-adenosyl-L-methionine-dependent methyltransferase [Hypoxylon sp. FL0543]
MFSNIRERLYAYLEPVEVLEWAIWAFSVTWWNALRSHGIRAFSKASRWRGEAFALWFRALSKMVNPIFSIWHCISDPVDPYYVDLERTSVIPALVGSAEGTVLEPGPGIGNHLPKFDRDKVKQVYGVESNEAFIPDLQAAVAYFQLGDKYTIICAGVEETDVLEKYGITAGRIDSIVCIQVLCSVAQPEAVVKEFYRLLKPGGKFIFWEHTRSCDRATRIIQNLWTIPCRFFLGGCNLNRDILRIIDSAGVWENVGSLQRLEENPWDVTPTVWGTFVKP